MLGPRDYQMANQASRLMVRTRGAAMVLTALTFLLYVYVDYGSCSMMLASAVFPAPLFIIWCAVGELPSSPAAPDLATCSQEL